MLMYKSIICTFISINEFNKESVNIILMSCFKKKRCKNVINTGVNTTWDQKSSRNLFITVGREQIIIIR